MTRIIPLDLPFELIQAIRLAHAVAESGYTVAIAPEHHPKFALLRHTFGLRFAEKPSRASPPIDV